MKGQPFLKRLVFALQGLYLAFRHERSMRFHILASAAVLAVLLIIQPSSLWWAIGALTIAMVIIVELMNAALETLADCLHPEQHPAIGAAKDMAAGAVLIAAVAAILVAVSFALSYI